MQRHGKIDAAKDPERTTEHAGLYAEACRQVAKEAGLPVLDVWTALQVCLTLALAITCMTRLFHCHDPCRCQAYAKQLS